MRRLIDPRRLGFCLVLGLLLAACVAAPARETATATPAVTAAIVERGVFDCFPAGLAKDDGEAVFCETSAVARSGGELIFANDKPVPGPGRSSVFALAGGVDGVVAGAPRYLTAAEFLAARKIEAMTVVPDTATILAATAFDRLKPGSAKWDAYNMLLAWPAGREDEVKIVARSTRDGIASSRSVRQRIAQALISDAFPQGPPYFKVEGLAALPDGRLLFGIRELGTSYEKDKFVYTMQIVSVSYEAGDAGVTLGEDFRLIYARNPSLVGAFGDKQVGLSSLEYDPHHDRLYVLTSYEHEDGGVKLLGAYLWVLSIDDLNSGADPVLVGNADGTPLAFAHKAEGIAVLDDRHVFVIHDDDEVLESDPVVDPERQFSRLPHQAAYTIVRLE